MRIALRAAASQDLRDAHGWYEKQQSGLGERFLRAIDTTFEAIVSRPKSFPAIRQSVRRALVKKFPYGVYFIIENHRCMVIAVTHGKRHPRSWRDRK